MTQYEVLAAIKRHNINTFLPADRNEVSQNLEEHINIANVSTNIAKLLEQGLIVKIKIKSGHKAKYEVTELAIPKEIVFFCQENNVRDATSLKQKFPAIYDDYVSAVIGYYIEEYFWTTMHSPPIQRKRCDSKQKSDLSGFHEYFKLMFTQNQKISLEDFKAVVNQAIKKHPLIFEKIVEQIAIYVWENTSDVLNVK